MVTVLCQFNLIVGKFQFDDKWEADRGFVHYDFNKPLDLPAGFADSFDMVVIDPPFITHEVWDKYSQTAKILLKKGSSDSGEIGWCFQLLYV